MLWELDGFAHFFARNLACPKKCWLACCFNRRKCYLELVIMCFLFVNSLIELNLLCLERVIDVEHEKKVGSEVQAAISVKFFDLHKNFLKLLLEFCNLAHKVENIVNGTMFKEGTSIIVSLTSVDNTTGYKDKGNKERKLLFLNTWENMVEVMEINRTLYDSEEVKNQSP